MEFNPNLTYVYININLIIYFCNTSNFRVVNKHVIFEVPITWTTKSTIFWDMIPCSLLEI
jgi:hypothetical protein